MSNHSEDLERQEESASRFLDLASRLAGKKLKK